MKTIKAFLLGATIAVLGLFSYQQHEDIRAQSAQIQDLVAAHNKLVEVIGQQQEQIANLVNSGGLHKQETSL